MTESKIKAALDFPPERVWEVVTDLKHYAWRSDLSRIEIQDDRKSFVEYTADGYATTFILRHLSLRTAMSSTWTMRISPAIGPAFLPGQRMALYSNSGNILR